MTSVIKNARLADRALRSLLFIERRRGNANAVASLTNVGLASRLRGLSSLLSTLIGVHGNLGRRMCLNGRRGRLRRASELSHHTVPARMNALVMGTLKAQQRGGQNGRRDKGDQAPQQIAGSRCRAKKSDPRKVRSHPRRHQCRRAAERRSSAAGQRRSRP